MKKVFAVVGLLILLGVAGRAYWVYRQVKNDDQAPATSGVGLVPVGVATKNTYNIQTAINALKNKDGFVNGKKTTNPLQIEELGAETYSFKSSAFGKEMPYAIVTYLTLTESENWSVVRLLKPSVSPRSKDLDGFELYDLDVLDDPWNIDIRTLFSSRRYVMVDDNRVVGVFTISKDDVRVHRTNGERCYKSGSYEAEYQLNQKSWKYELLKKDVLTETSCPQTRG